MDLWSMVKRQRGKCALTGLKLKGNIISLDHIIPRSKGGNNDKSNLHIVLYHANSMKGSLMDQDFINLCSCVIKNTNGLLGRDTSL